eukprot:TRINITY_DN1295_c2_g1_i3.p1 TRINITY_DN1295_c2_g1~~TRINITY_DN1295_c2_g1_i3.p1  ORF type:complete len:594 (-),score=74.98 TRINITY_DN1295_c2_g1_i3:61-1803(-)
MATCTGPSNFMDSMATCTGPSNFMDSMVFCFPKRKTDVPTKKVVYKKSSAPEIVGRKAEIYTGRCEDGDSVVAECTISRTKKGFEHSVDREVSIWKDISDPGHDGILRLYHFFKNSAVVAMELVNPIGFDLVALSLQYRYSGKNIPVALTASITVQLMDALQYLHEEKEILHRNMKSVHVLMTMDMQVKLRNFELAMSIPDMVRDKKLRCIDRDFSSNIAPEIPRGNDIHPRSYDGKVDVYGIGWILSELYGFRHHHTADEFSPTAPKTSQHVFETWRKVITSDPRHRFTLERLRDEPWLSTRRDHSLLDRLGIDDVKRSRPRKHLHRFSERLIAVSATLRSPFPADGIELVEVTTKGWTCLLIERSDGSVDTSPSANTRLFRSDRVYFGIRDVTSTQVTLRSDEDVRNLFLHLDTANRLIRDIQCDETVLREGSELISTPKSEIAMGVPLTFRYDSEYLLRHKLRVDLSKEGLFSDDCAFVPFYLEFDAFKFPEHLVTPSAVIGPPTDRCRGLNFRDEYKINLGGIARPSKAGWCVDWMPLPTSEVFPGDCGLVVRAPTKAGLSVPTISDEQLLRMKLV